MIKLAIFASGSGTNAKKIIEHFANNESINVSSVFSNSSKAFVLQRAKALDIPAETFNRSEFLDPGFLNQRGFEKIDFIILAGFLWKIPLYLIDAFPDKILNIHPALLPKYGGKGMYGEHVHNAVIEAGEKESGITIHLVNENYDEGRILFQAPCDVHSNDSPETLASKIHRLEHEHYPKVIEEFVLSCP